MIFKLFLVFCLYYQVECLTKSTLRSYLYDQTEKVKHKLIYNKEGLPEIKFSILKNFTQQESVMRAHTFAVFNTVYVLLDRDLYATPNNSLVRQFILDEDTRFLKSIVFNETGIVLLAETTGNVRIYGIAKETWNLFFIHKIRSNISDAAFFANRNALFLVTTTVNSNNSASVVLYRFTGTHFDEIQTVPVVSATKVTTFPNEQSEMIIILQNSVSSELYEFHLEKMKKIQKIETKHPAKVLTYLYDNKRFIAIFNQTNKIQHYLWTGTSLMLWMESTIDLEVDNVVVLHRNNTPVIASSKTNTITGIILDPNQRELRENAKFANAFSKILTIETVNIENATQIAVIGSKIPNFVEIDIVAVNLTKSSYYVEEKEEKELLDCMMDLEQTAYDVRAKLRNTKNKTDSILRARDDPSLAPTFANNTQFIIEVLDDHATPLAPKFHELSGKINNVKLAIRDYNGDFDNLVVNGTTIVKNSVEALTVIGGHVEPKKVNGKQWLPEQLLAFSKPQTITGHVQVKKLKLDNLEHNSYNDVVRVNGTHKINVPVIVKNVKAGALNSVTINDIEVANIYKRNSQVPISGLKTFQNLTIKNAKIIRDVNKLKIDDVMALLTNLDLSKYHFNDVLQVNNLWVGEVNGINWENFKSSVFLIGASKNVTGDLTFSRMEVGKANFNSILSIGTDNFLTTSTDQVVSSVVEISEAITQNITTNTTNNIKFKKAAATFGGAPIKGPVRIDDLQVMNDLTMTAKLDPAFTTMDNQRVIGMNESDFFQMYNGKTIIEGNLHVKNFEFTEATKLVVSGKLFNPQINEFWTKTSEQTIPTHFVGNSVTAPHMFTRSINNLNINNLMINSASDKQTTKFNFEKIRVKGNIILNDSRRNLPELKKVLGEAVKSNGSFQISGHKIYGNLKVDKLETHQLDGIDISDMLTRNCSSTPLGTKFFEHLIIDGNLASQILTNVINDINVTKLQEESFRINEEQNLEELNFKNISVKHLHLVKLNNHHMNEHVLKLDRLYSLDTINNMYVEKDVQMVKVQNLSMINDVNVAGMMQNSTLKYHNNIVHGNIKFEGATKIHDLHATIINNQNFSALFKRLLYRKWNQSIVAPLVFHNIKTKNLVATVINNVTVADLVDVSNQSVQTLYVPNGIRIMETNQVRSLFADLSCDLSQALQTLKNTPRQTWGNVTVAGNVTFWDSENILSKIFEKAVTSNGSNFITGTVNFTKHICANNVSASKHINNINLQDIVDDALLLESEDRQVVSGKKTFSQIAAAKIQVLENIDVVTINKINISEVDSKIDLGDVDVIKGKKLFFGGLQAVDFYAQFVTNVDSTNLVSIGNPTSVPQVIFGSLVTTKNFHVNYINKIDFNLVLENKLLLNAPGQTPNGTYFFTYIKVGNLKTHQINELKIKNVVFDTDTQMIGSAKKFTQQLTIIGNADIEYINGFKMSSLFEKAIIKNEPAHLQGQMTILRPSTVEGSITTETINNFSMNHLTKIMHEGLIKAETDQIYEISTKIQQFLKKNLDKALRLPTEYLYFEKSNDMQISISNTIDAKAIVTRGGDVLIHIDGEESGEFCGLPDFCKCPIQSTMQVSSEHSISSLMNKGSQRVYSYNDDQIMVHLLSNSISTNSLCRTKKTQILNEVSSLTWNTMSTENTTKGFHKYREFFPGYISGVEFFALNGETYAVIGRYYDPVVNNHNLGCIVLKFSPDKTELQEIQKIPVQGLWKLSLFYTAQGVILIVGNSDEFSNSWIADTRIFRFNPTVKQFQLLRTISFQTKAAAGVVLAEDSLIVLANKQSTLQILKYQPNFDNYYFYQSFQLENQIFGLSVFYTGNFGISDAFLCVVTKNNKYLVYSFRFVEGWRLESSGELDGVKSLVPFELNQQLYLFAPSAKLSSLLTVVKYDSN